MVRFLWITGDHFPQTQALIWEIFEYISTEITSYQKPWTPQKNTLILFDKIVYMLVNSTW